MKRMSRVLGRAVCSVAAKRLLNKALQMRKEYAGSLLKFAKPMQHLRYACTTFDDGCPNGHYTKIVDGDNSVVDRTGHPIVCSNDGGCKSKLRILRAASVHYPVLGNLLH